MHYPTMNIPWRSQTHMHETSGWMALAWAVAAFLGGTMLGMMFGKKKAMIVAAHGGMPSSGGRMSGMPMWKHHHHGSGQAACHMKHETTGPVAPGAESEKPGERNEGE